MKTKQTKESKSKKLVYYWEWNVEDSSGFSEVKLLTKKQYETLKKDSEHNKRNGVIINITEIDTFKRRPNKPILYVIRNDGKEIAKYEIKDNDQLQNIISSYKNNDFIDFVILDKKGLSYIKKLHDEVFVDSNRHKALTKKIYKILAS